MSRYELDHNWLGHTVRRAALGRLGGRARSTALPSATHSAGSGQGSGQALLGRRSEAAATRLLQACRMGLHRFAPDLLARTEALVAEDAAFVSLVQTCEHLLLLHRAREPLEAHDLPGVV